MRYLLSGGQACILYGGAEFSRDADIVVLVSPENLDAIRRALRELDAEQVFFPALDAEALRRGHACHFRCRHPGAAGLRLDIMAVLRGCDPFARMWERRSEVDAAGVGLVPVMSLADLVQSKKTQREKDAGHVRRLVETDYLARRNSAPDAAAEWWLSELRTPSYLVELARARPHLVPRIRARPWLARAVTEGESPIERALDEEWRRIREEDKAYWAPLREELERMRRGR